MRQSFVFSSFDCSDDICVLMVYVLISIRNVYLNVILETGTSLENRNYNIDVTDIEKVLKTLKNNKATGFDNIAYEHLTYGGNCLKWHMMNLLIWKRFVIFLQC
jgi:meiotically up-regulated gene 157 (Mug157) protein